MAVSYFPEAESKSWQQLRTLCERRYRSSYSCNIPLHPPFSRDMLFLSPAFTVMTAPIPADPRGTDYALPGGTVASLRTRMVNFLFGEAPFLPDFRLTRLRRTEPPAPIYESRFFLADNVYLLETFVPPAAEPDRAVCLMKFTVRNEGEVENPAHVRVHLANPVERDVIPFDYFPFHLDRENFPAADSSARFLNDSTFFLDGKQVLKVIDNGGFGQKFEPHWNCPETAWEQPLPCLWSSHHFFRVRPELRIAEGHNFLHFSTVLKPGEGRSIQFAFAVSNNDLASIEIPGWEEARIACAAFWREQLDRTGFHFDFGSPERNNLAEVLQVTNLQLFRRNAPGDQFQMPCQGHSDRFHIWITEALAFLNGMCDFGYYAEVRRVLELFLSWQDGSAKPEGEFTSLDGAIGNPGPRWANTTGGVLSAAAKYLALSHDAAFWETHKSGLKRAAAWILNEVTATRNQPDPNRAGIMPPACATDEDHDVLALTSTDHILVCGLFDLLSLDEMKKEPEYDDLCSRTEQYRAAIRRVALGLQQKDGFIPRMAPTQTQTGSVFHKFDGICGTPIMTRWNILDPEDENTRRLYDWFEKNSFDEFFTGRMDSDLVYVGWNEFELQSTYWKLGRWKTAWALMRYFRLYAVTADLQLTLERFSRSEPAHTPFQPNGSCNGRVLSNLVASLYFRYLDGKGRDVRIFLAGDAPFDFEENSRRSCDCDTAEGRLVLRVENGRFEAEWDRPQPEFQFRLPEHFDFVPDKNTLKPLGGNVWLAAAGSTRISGRIALKR